MKYYTFKYEIAYNDGSGKHGEVPFRGETGETEGFVRHIQSFFGGPNAGDANITISDVKEYKDGEEWIKSVHSWETFKYLYSAQNYGGELMLEHFPEVLAKWNEARK